ncbi:MAG: T9SS type A sorting domain-containing protein [Bacteroidales bacterium]|nr:T9SS type A sorting domain-containing protein [Bacteroidales bacterium]
MLKKILIVLFISAFIPFNMNAQWVSLDKKEASNTPPKVTILSDDNNSTVIKIDLSGFEIKEFFSEGKTYQSVDLLTDIFSTEPGSPELPYISKILAIPDQSGISVEVLKTSEIQTFKNINLQPARKSWFEGKPESPYKENAKAYKSTDVYPKEYASVEPPSVFRDFRIARVSVFPLRYVPAKNEIHAVSSITIRINYGKGEVVNPKTTSKKAIAPSFAKLYKSFIFNYNTVLNKFYNGNENGREVMLCIMPDNFADSFQPYAEWKRQSGTDVHITKFSDINANSNNPVIIKDHITDAYHNWENPPTYVLLVGDDGVFPKRIVNYDYSFPNEDFFVEIDGDDFFPEMMVGRLTNQNDYKLQVMLNKFMKYEKEPYTADTNWFKKAACFSNNDYESQVSTKRFVAGILLEDGGFTSVDTLMSDGTFWGGCSMDLSDVLNTINEGRSYLNYRGEGWSDGWAATCYDFNTSDVSGLNNGEKLTFVTSIGCGVAMFNSYSSNCFGEEWLELGSIDNPRGAVAFVGPGSNTHTTYNNRIDKGIYVGMFQEGMDTPGQALLRGKLYLYNVFGADPMVEYHYRVFYVLGDPSIHIWKDIPLSVNVSHSSSIPIGYSQPEITITYASSGLPVANAQVCLVGDDVYATGFSDSTGIVNIGITPEMEETLTITVRGGTVIPYQGTIDVIQTAEHVGPNGYPIIVDLDGNTDGIINPNENCNITFTLKNWGTQTSNNVEATLTVIETDYVEIITTNPVSFGNLASGGTFTGDPFQFFIKPNCPVGQMITLELHVTSSTSSWEYIFIEEIMGCELKYINCIVDDEDATNRNFRMDPGETVKLYLSIENVGVDVAPNVIGILRSDDQYITIEDSTGSFGTINTNSVAMNTENYFVVTIDPSCPIEYYAEYSLKLNTQNGNYPYQTILNFTIPVAVPMPSDYTGPDAYGYYAYSNDDTLYEQAPDYDWMEINGNGTKIQVPSNTTDYTKTVDLPFVFKYYGVDYNQLRISTDGWIAFGSGTQTISTNYALPHNDNVNCMIAAFWDDLYDPYYEEGDIYYYNDNANHRFIVEWDGVAHNYFSWPPNTETFQAILLNPAYYQTTTGDGEIIVQYKKVKLTNSNTVGIENHLQDVGLQYVFDKGYDPTASVLGNELAIKFTTETPLIIVSVDEETENKLISGLYLEQNYPNPFNSQTRINYTVPNQSNVSLKIYNIKGELVRTLQNGQQQEGKYSVRWKGINDSGNHVCSGIYFYRLQTENFIETRKLFMIK